MNTLPDTTRLTGVVDSVFILDREKRTENRATRFCTDRDIESVELKLELNHDTHVWNHISEKVGEEIKLIDEVIEMVHEYLVFSCADYIGTATGLSAEIEKSIGKTVNAATLIKRLIKFHGQLETSDTSVNLRELKNLLRLLMLRRCVGRIDTEPQCHFSRRIVRKHIPNVCLVNHYLPFSKLVWNQFGIMHESLLPP